MLVLTMFDDDESVFAAMRAGARGYLVKGASQEEISRAITAVAAGEAIFGPGVARRVLGYFAAPPAAAAEPFPELTPREREVLDLIAAGLPNAAIAGRLGLAGKTVGNHISSDLRQAPGRQPGRGDHPGPRGRPRPPLTPPSLTRRSCTGCLPHRANRGCQCKIAGGAGGTQATLSVAWIVGRGQVVVPASGSDAIRAPKE